MLEAQTACRHSKQLLKRLMDGMLESRPKRLSINFGVRFVEGTNGLVLPIGTLGLCFLVKNSHLQVLVLKNLASIILGGKRVDLKEYWQSPNGHPKFTDGPLRATLKKGWLE